MTQVIKNKIVFSEGLSHQCSCSCCEPQHNFASLGKPPVLGKNGLWTFCGPCGDVHACVLSRFSCVWLFVTLWTVAHQAPLSMGFYRQEYWSGLPYPPPGDLLDQGIEPVSLNPLASQAGPLPLAPPGKPRSCGNILGYNPAILLHVLASKIQSCQS